MTLTRSLLLIYLCYLYTYICALLFPIYPFSTDTECIDCLNHRCATVPRCRELKNLNAFFAIVMGLSNSAVLRLTQTWERLPSKFRKMYSAFEVLIDPTRNHRAYRVYMADLLPPIIPFMPLLIKGKQLGNLLVT